MIQASDESAPRKIGKYLALIIIVLVSYFLAGKLGQATTAIRSGNIGPVWPAFGVALAAVLLFGYRIWPGIFIGVFLVDFLSPVPAVAALGQASGATLAAITGAFALRRIAGFESSFSRLRDALAMIVLGAFGSALISATIGVSVLYATHVEGYSGLGPAWLIYWLGDATGGLLVTPLILDGRQPVEDPQLGPRHGVCQPAASSYADNHRHFYRQCSGAGEAARNGFCRASDS